MEQQILRPLGRAERAAAARHYLGHYRSVCHTARYLNKKGETLQHWKKILMHALSTFIIHHGALCTGLVGEETEQPHFVRLHQVDLDERVAVVTLNSLTDEAIAEHLGQQHELMWPNIAEHPGWKINVLGTPGQNHEVEVVLVFHHAFFDGISALNIHSMIHNALLQCDSNAIIADSVVAPIFIPPTCNPLPPVEELTPLPLSWTCLLSSWKFILKNYYGIPIPSLPSWMCWGNQKSKGGVWTGNATVLPTLGAYRCHVRLLTLEHTKAKQLKAICKQQECSITGLLHGIIVHALAKLYPLADGFYGHTPYSMRPWTGTDVTVALCNETSDHGCLYSREDIQYLASGDGVDDKDRQAARGIWTLARKFKASLKSHLQSVPRDNELAIIRYIASWHSFLKEQVGKPRQLSFEVSNVGTYNNTEAQTSQYTMARYFQSQSGYVSGPPLSISTANMHRGPLTVTMSWQDGAVDREVPDAIITEIVFWLNHITTSSTTE